jgi:polo-like kinase 1
LHRTIEYIEYVSTSAGKKQEKSTYSALLEKHQYPGQLQKKVVLLHYFKSYMAEHSANKDSEHTSRVSAPTPLVYVQKWLRTKHAIVFRLSNKTVQVFNLIYITCLLINDLRSTSLIIQRLCYLLKRK